MKYASEYPPEARARVEAERLRAYAALEQDVKGIASWRRDAPFIHCVMRVFLAFVREACAFAKKSNHPAWSDRELDQRCRDFLLSIVIDAWEDKAKDLGIRKMFSSSSWGYSLNDDDRRKIEQSSAWKLYQELLLGAFETQSARPLDCSAPERGPDGENANFHSGDPVPLGTSGPGTPVQPEPVTARTKPISTTCGSGAGPKRQHGFKPDTNRHNAIADAVGSDHSGWRNDSVLKHICVKLDQDEIDIPENWRTGKTKSLNGSKLRNWSEAFELDYRKLIKDQISYSLDIIRRKSRGLKGPI